MAAAHDNGTIAILRVKPPSSYVLPPRRPVPDAAKLAKQPSSADALRRADIPEELLAKAGGGDPRKALLELVAILAKNGHQGQVFSAVISPDGRMLASAGADRPFVCGTWPTGACGTC